jgi:hypothetical protein
MYSYVATTHLPTVKCIRIYYNNLMACVYGLVSKSNPSVIRYVGRSRYNTPEIRLEQHIRNAKKDSTNLHVYNWIRKCVSLHEEIDYIVLATNISWEDSGIEEINYIKKLKDQGHDLTNMTLGGEGSLGVKASSETKAKMSASRKGRVVSEETRLKISKANAGKKRTAETKEKLSNAIKGKPGPNKGKEFSEEWRKNMSDAHKGKTPWNKGK